MEWSPTTRDSFHYPFPAPHHEVNKLIWSFQVVSVRWKYSAPQELKWFKFLASNLDVHFIWAHCISIIIFKRYTNSDLKISLCIQIHMKIVPWKLRIQFFLKSMLIFNIFDCFCICVNKHFANFMGV